MSIVYAYEVSVASTDWKRTINSTSRGKAKAEYWREVTDAWPDIPFTAIRARKIGPPFSSPDFVRNAEYRSLPNARCGDRVSVGAARGVIVGHNSSANFNVLFDEDSTRYAGLTLNVHPSSLVFI